MDAGLLNDLARQLGALTPEATAVAVVLGLGYVLRCLPLPGWVIPPACVLAPAVFYPWIADWGSLPAGDYHPGARLVCTGFLIGLTAWMLHNRLLNRWLDPAVRRVLGMAGRKRSRPR